MGVVGDRERARRYDFLGQLADSLLDDRRSSAPQVVELFPIDIDTDDWMSARCQTCSRDRADVAEPENGDSRSSFAHDVLTLSAGENGPLTIAPDSTRSIVTWRRAPSSVHVMEA